MSAVAAMPVGSDVLSPKYQDEPLYEIIDGIRVEIPPMSTRSGIVASRLFSQLSEFTRKHDLGESVIEVLFRLPLEKGRSRRPDLAFVSHARWPKSETVDDENGWEVVPDLAVEVISPHDMIEDVQDKLSEYFQCGVRQVWVIFPRHRLVYVYDSLHAIRGLSATDELDGGTVLPGFRVPLAGLFV